MEWLQLNLETLFTGPWIPDLENYSISITGNLQGNIDMQQHNKNVPSEWNISGMDNVNAPRFLCAKRVFHGAGPKGCFTGWGGAGRETPPSPRTRVGFPTGRDVHPWNIELLAYYIQ